MIYTRFFLLSKTLELISLHETHMSRQPLVGAFNFDFSTRVFSPTIDCHLGTSLVEFKSNQYVNREFVPPVNLPSLHQNIRQSTQIISKADTAFAGLISNLGCIRLVYTDGSKSLDGSAGFSMFFGYSLRFKMYTVSGLLTIFDIELMAIFYATQHIGEEAIGAYAIASDSLSSLSALSSVDKKGNAHRLIYEIKANISKLQTQGYVISLIWIPRHAGIWGNDVADHLADIAAKSDAGMAAEMQICENCLYFPRNLFSGFKSESYAESHNSFKGNTSVGYRYFNRVKEKLVFPWFYQFNHLSRKDITSINRILSGHARLNGHLFSKNIVQDPHCSCGYEIQTLEHIFFGCPDFTQETDTLILALATSNLDSQSTNSLLTDPHKAIPAFLKFVNSSSLLL